jgi:DNA-binding NarL/FixJ family response regulator
MAKSLMASVKETLGLERVSTLEDLFLKQLQDLLSAEKQMTGSVDSQDVETCTQLGVTAYLPKSVPVDTFARIIGASIVHAVEN